MSWFNNSIANLTRSYNRFKKKNSKLRLSIPFWLVRYIKGAEETYLNISKSLSKVEYKSENTNIFHCCVQKTGSVWIKSLLSDPVIYKYSGLKVSPYGKDYRQKLTDSVAHLFTKPFPAKTIVSAFKGSYENYIHDIPKHEGKQKAFFVIRDPRELAVSYYFSSKNSHVVKAGSKMSERREYLNSVDQVTGLKYAIDVLCEKDMYRVMADWISHAKDKEILIVKYEDLIGDNKSEKFRELLTFMDIKVPDDVFDRLIEDYGFEKLTGRKKGEENVNSHLRSGAAKTWDRYFDEEVMKHYNEKVGDIVADLPYD